MRPPEGLHVRYLTYLCLFMLKWTEIGKPFIIYWESDDVFCRVPFTSYSMMTVVWRRSLIFSTCQLLSIKIHVVQIIRLIVQPLNFLKLITLIKFWKGFLCTSTVTINIISYFLTIQWVNLNLNTHFSAVLSL